MSNLETLLEQIRQFEDLDYIRIFTPNGVCDLAAIKNNTLLADEFRERAHKLYLDLTFYVLGRHELKYIPEHAQELADAGYSVETVQQDTGSVYYLHTKAGKLKF